MRLNYKYVIENLTNLDGHPIEKLSENEWRLHWEGEWKTVEKRGRYYEEVLSKEKKDF